MQRAAGVILNAVVGALVALATDSTSRPSPTLRVFVAAGALTLLYIILTSGPLVSRFPLLARIPGANKEEAGVAEDKSIHVTSHNQSGGITAHTVNVSETPPNIDVAILRENAKRGNAFVTSIGIDLAGRPARFGVAALGKSIRDVSLRQDGPSTALFNVEHGTTDQGAHFFVCGNPNPGRYIAEIESTESESDLKIEPIVG